MAKLSVRQKKEIRNSISLTRIEWVEIRNNKGEWDKKNLDPIKDRIRKFYKIEQNKLCAFCKLPFRDDVQVEHVVPKGGKFGRREYAFYSKNLVAACKHCNTSKSTNNDMIPWDRKSYPINGWDFKIIHPHFDRYFDHIEIVDKSRYVAKTLKGYRTIRRCKLYETSILEVLVEAMRYQDDAFISGYLRIKDLVGDFKPKIDKLINKVFIK